MSKLTTPQPFHSVVELPQRPMQEAEIWDDFLAGIYFDGNGAFVGLAAGVETPALAAITVPCRFTTRLEIHTALRVIDAANVLVIRTYIDGASLAANESIASANQQTVANMFAVDVPAGRHVLELKVLNQAGVGVGAGDRANILARRGRIPVAR